MSDPLKLLAGAGVSVWLDDLSRHRLASGDLAARVRSGAREAGAGGGRPVRAVMASVDRGCRGCPCRAPFPGPIRRISKCGKGMHMQWGMVGAGRTGDIGQAVLG